MRNVGTLRGGGAVAGGAGGDKAGEQAGVTGHAKRHSRGWAGGVG